MTLNYNELLNNSIRLTYIDLTTARAGMTDARETGSLVSSAVGCK